MNIKTAYWNYAPSYINQETISFLEDLLKEASQKIGISLIFKNENEHKLNFLQLDQTGKLDISWSDPLIVKHSEEKYIDTPPDVKQRTHKEVAVISVHHSKGFN